MALSGSGSWSLSWFRWIFQSKALKDRQTVFIETLGQLKTRAVFVSSESKCWCHSTELQALGKRCSLLFISLHICEINLNVHEMYFLTVFKDMFFLYIKKPSEYVNIWKPVEIILKYMAIQNNVLKQENTHWTSYEDFSLKCQSPCYCPSLCYDISKY